MWKFEALCRSAAFEKDKTLAETTYLSLIIPAYREEENLRLLLPRVRAALTGFGAPFEIIVVDTVAPFDLTRKVCEEAGARSVPRGPTNSYGDAVRTGLAIASGEWIAFMDADGSHAPEMVLALIAKLPDYDVVVGSRYVPGGHTENSWVLRLMSRIVNACFSIVLGLPVRDVSNSLKIYRASLIKPLRLRTENFDIIEEILFKLVRKNSSLRIVEVPVNFRKRMFGETKRNLAVFMLSYAITLFRLRFMPLD